jgi:hypothetical protein
MAQQTGRLFLLFRMTPRTCSERLAVMQALSAQLCRSTIVGFRVDAGDLAVTH